MPTSFNSTWRVACFTSQGVIYRRGKLRGVKLDLICSVNTQPLLSAGLTELVLMHSSFHTSGSAFSATGRRIWVLSIWVWLCTHWFDATKNRERRKIMQTPHCGRENHEYTPHGSAKCSRPGCHLSPKHRLLNINISRWTMPAGVVIGDTLP